MIDLSASVAHLTNGRISYVLEVDERGTLVHRYAGCALRAWNSIGMFPYFKRGYNTSYGVGEASYDDYPFEVPCWGRGDYRLPALAVRRQDGAQVAELRFVSWRVLHAKPSLEGLPSTRASRGEGETLEVVLADAAAGVTVTLLYTIFSSVDVVARSMRVENAGEAPLQVETALSASLELPPGNYEALTLWGTHAKEGQRDRFPLHRGVQRVSSACGSSSPQHQPFIAVVDANATYDAGEVWGLVLVYSGNFIAQAELDQFGCVRVQIGINPDTFSWRLDPGASFQTPEALLAYSADGLNGMSWSFQRTIREHLMPARFVRRERPILLNSWEAMYYDVSMAKIDRQVALAQKAGMELFVLDDGWFRADNSSWTSMGDWRCNLEKLPEGLEAVARRVHDAGMLFGLWFEPEAIGPTSQLFADHPDWALGVPGYERVEGRHEYLLDLMRQDVRDHVVGMLDNYLSSGFIDYIKWDMNRPLTDVFSPALAAERQGEVAHRYVLGLYEVLRRVTAAYPDVLFETCSSGGARLDAGMLAFAAQNWASDNTDAYDRASIQLGLGLLYPTVALGAHVSCVPNHQTGRGTSLEARFEVARAFNVGYELDLSMCADDELAEISRQVAAHKRERAWMQNARLYCIACADDNHIAWSVVAPDGSRAHLWVLQKRCDPTRSHGRVRWRGLDSAARYRVMETGEVVGGDELMYVGMTFPLVKEDCHVETREVELISSGEE